MSCGSIQSFYKNWCNFHIDLIKGGTQGGLTEVPKGDATNILTEEVEEMELLKEED